MKYKIFILCIGALFFMNQKSYAQWTVIDPTNLVQNIRSAVQGTTTAANMIKNFEETVKIYKQGV